MMHRKRLEISDVGDITVARLIDQRIIDESSIEGLGNELFALIKDGKCKKLLLNFVDVEFLSSAVLNKLIILHKKLNAGGGSLKLCSLRKEILEIFTITKLDKLFAIEKDPEAGLEAFSAKGNR